MNMTSHKKGIMTKAEVTLSCRVGGVTAGIAVVAVLVFLVPWPPVRVALALDAPWRPPCLVVARGAVLSPSMGLVAFLPLDPAASLAAPML